MAKKITWSENALQDRLQILDYWYKRIGNKKYSLYLDNCFRETVNLIGQFPQIGRIHSEISLRFMVRENYLIFYEEEKAMISILGIFDSRRNPELVKDKFKL
jgi:toxin YoeB